MNTDHLSHVIIAAVLVTALAGVYVVLQPPAALTGAPVVDIPPQNVDTLGTCCCGSQSEIFTVPSGTLLSNIKATTCDQACGEHTSTRHPVVSLGSC